MVHVSTIIATILRPSLEQCVLSVLRQEADVEFGLIIINDSGWPLPPSVWQGDHRVRVLNTQRRERCHARNAGAAMAHGRYLHFLDDDDYLLPGAWTALHRLQQEQPDYACYQGATQLVDRKNRPLYQVQPQFQGDIFVQAVAGEWFPLQATWIDAHLFFREGGFNPHTVGSEDIDLMRRLAFRARTSVTSQEIAAVTMGAEGSATRRDIALELGRAAREELLSRPYCFSRLRQSAQTPYWRGRIARAYATSTVWNGSRRRWLTAASRFLWMTLAIVANARHLLHPDFRRAFSKPHQGIAFEKGRHASQFSE